MIFDGTFMSLKLEKKANQILSLMRHNLSACNHSVKEAAYNGLVRVLLEYACSAQDPYTDQLIKKSKRCYEEMHDLSYQITTSTSQDALQECLRTLAGNHYNNAGKLTDGALNNVAVLQFTELVKESSRTTRSMNNKHF